MNYKNNIKVILVIISVLCNFSIAQKSDSNIGTLNHYDFSGDNSITVTLPKKIKEISGLAVTSNNRYFAHNDEIGTVFEIDISSGKILNEFYLGNKKIKKDFEGIAVVDDSLYMVTSSGVLYKFSFPDDEQSVEYKKFNTFLSVKNDVEGLCFDRVTNSLLVACKGFAGKNFKGYRAVYSFDLATLSLKEEPAFLINLDELKQKFNIKNFSPSGIEVHPKTSNLFLISANQKAIVELSAEGDLLNAVKLDPELHPQPEGITFSSDLELIISDEGKNKKARLTIYPTFK
jgi:uncharacterized protein YjiK